LVRIVQRFTPWLWEAFDAVDDSREGPLYAMRQVLCLGILMFACRLPSLRRLDEVSNDVFFRDNWNVFSRAKSDTVICSRQMTNVLKDIAPEQIGDLRVRLIKGMIRDKQLPDAFLLKHVMVVSDGSGIFSSSQEHCDRCLFQEHQDGSKTYLHNVLEVKVITHTGLALSLMTEPLLNPEDRKYDKQDCESKAFKRALPRIKEAFPRELLVHLLDSGYCNGPLFKAIEAVNQKFICCFKEGSIPTLYEEALALRKLGPENRKVRKFIREGHTVKQVFTWVTGLEYQEVKLNFVMCEETVEGKTTTFAYLTNFAVDRENVLVIANGGRKRWTIENQGFNEQKTGYELEHFCDCASFEIMFCLYLLLQLAHAFMQLLARSNLIDPVDTLTFLALLLLEALRNAPLSEELFDHNAASFQVRLTREPT
jgi:hypothetical protein